MRKRFALQLLIFCWVWITFAYFRQARPDWNVNSRMSLTFAIVEQHSFMIDKYQRMEEFNSGGDRSKFEGHYYSDKIIGASLLGAIPLTALKGVSALTGVYFSIRQQRYWVTIMTSGLFAALGALLLFDVLQKLGCEIELALVIMAGYVFGTQAAGYATLFYAYTPALFFELAAFNLLLTDEGEVPRHSRVRLCAAGLCLGAALLCEYVFGIVAIGLTAYLFFQLKEKWKIIVFGLSALPPLTLFAAYTLICFKTINIPYQYLESELFREGMSRGLMGIRRFQLPVLWLITLHPYRGLFFYSPLLLPALLGLAMQFRAPQRRPLAWLILFIVAGDLLFNASYYMWWGGWTYGPRHLLAAVPFLTLPLVELSRRGRFWRVLICFSVVWSVCLNMFAVTVGPNYPQGYPHEYLLRPEFSTELYSPLLIEGFWLFINGHLQPNWGHALGLKNLWSLLPLAIFWLLMLSALFALLRRPAQASAPAAPLKDAAG